MSDSKTKWAWWAGRHEEWLQVGPEQTRDDAIIGGREYVGEGEGDFIIMEAVMAELRLDAHGTLETWLDQWADDSDLFSSENEAPELGGTADEQKAATADLQAALDAWQARWAKILPTPNMFAATRNQEWISNAVDPDMLSGGHDNPREPDE